ncbi:hypothetical protein F511_13876 [Dorcoceras hygrometricum]|uniref:Secreted protein n=1 Tax=Dorcoceras hygrometricum TaxID=472368 RepID=A0A2Z7BCX5_9LAMI|nr:hypothetical protein F511_13876 [Dorcoceras hygrometricum]
MYSLLLVAICVVLVAADQQAHLCKSVKKRRRLIKWKRCVLSFSFERSAVGSNVYVTKVTSFGLVDTSSFGVISRYQQIDCFEARAVVSWFLLRHRFDKLERCRFEDFHRIQPLFLEIFVALNSPCLALSFATHLRRCNYAGSGNAKLLEFEAFESSLYLRSSASVNFWVRNSCGLSSVFSS